jgi:hypothetical protein
MGHVPVENGTITFVVALRHNEVFEAGHELEKCPGLRRALLGSEAPGCDNIRKKVVREAWRITAFSALCGFESQLELPSNDSDIRSGLFNALYLRG